MKKFLSFTNPPPLDEEVADVAEIKSVANATRADGLQRRVRGISLSGLDLGKWYEAVMTGKKKEKKNKEEGWYEWLVQVRVEDKLYFVPANDSISDKLDNNQDVTNGKFKFFLNQIEGSDVKWANPLEYTKPKFA